MKLNAWTFLSLMTIVGSHIYFGAKAHANDKNVNAIKTYCMSDCVHEATFLKRYAGQGSMLAEFALSILQIQGVGIDKNVERGLLRLKKAAKHKEPAAQFQLAHFYHRGIFVEKDLEKARILYKQAHRSGANVVKKYLKEVEKELLANNQLQPGLSDTDYESGSVENSDLTSPLINDLKDLEVIKVYHYASYDQILEAAKNQTCNGACGPKWSYIAAPMILLD